MYKSKKPQPVSRELLSNAHEVVSFTSDKGREFNKFKQIEEDSKIYLNNGKGIAILCVPMSGPLKANSEVLVNCTIYNETVGSFDDTLECQIKGLAKSVFPVKLVVKGNPLQLAPFQPGVSYDKEPNVIKVGHVIINNDEIYKKFKIMNNGSLAIKIGNLIIRLENL